MLIACILNKECVYLFRYSSSVANVVIIMLETLPAVRRKDLADLLSTLLLTIPQQVRTDASLGKEVSPLNTHANIAGVCPLTVDSLGLTNTDVDARSQTMD